MALRALLLLLLLAQEKNTGFIPLTELGSAKYKERDGGLYGGGSNTLPKEQAERAKKETAKIAPLDKEGKPADDGKIVLLSIGMSNTTQEFSAFVRTAQRDKDLSPKVALVDGAQGGQTASRIADESANFWKVVDDRLAAATVTAKQVQAVWLKEANAGPKRDFPAEADALQKDLAKIVDLLAKRFPNLRVIYLSSRIYAGYATTQLNPEPHAYESAFAVRGLILDQVRLGAKATGPVLLWGPYLWGDGTKARKDGLVWKKEDFGNDGTHPSDSGRQKVADLLLAFFKGDETAKSWFVKR
jgi:hypothetical protein